MTVSAAMRLRKLGNRRSDPNGNLRLVGADVGQFDAREQTAVGGRSHHKTGCEAGNDGRHLQRLDAVPVRGDVRLWSASGIGVEPVHGQPHEQERGRTPVAELCVLSLRREGVSGPDGRSRAV